MQPRKTWTGLFGGLGDAVLHLVRVETEVVFDRWKRSIFELIKIFAALFLVLLIFVYLPFLVLLTLVDAIRALADWPIWGASLLVLGLVLLVVGALAAFAYYIFDRKFEGFHTTVGRRLDDHKVWWHERAFHERRRLEEVRDELPQ